MPWHLLCLLTAIPTVPITYAGKRYYPLSGLQPVRGDLRTRDPNAGPRDSVDQGRQGRSRQPWLYLPQGHRPGRHPRRSRSPASAGQEGRRGMARNRLGRSLRLCGRIDRRAAGQARAEQRRLFRGQSQRAQLGNADARRPVAKGGRYAQPFLGDVAGSAAPPPGRSQDVRAPVLRADTGH